MAQARWHRCDPREIDGRRPAPWGRTPHSHAEGRFRISTNTSGPGHCRLGTRAFRTHLLKDTPPETLVDGLRVVAAGEALLSPTVTKRLIEQFAKQPNPTAPDAAVFHELTDREHDVLLCIARGLSNAEISESLFVSEATVKTHVSRVLAKLGVRDRVQAVVLAYEHGLVTPGITD
ncbi:UNVERIFIED_CONTAM: hypothetical protein GTU68_029259 [Idotea baltica]|nr:hypothetical protein [Idotea baltica]